MNNNKELHELCKGCRSYARITQDGKKVFRRSCMLEIPIKSPNDKCPCMTCLIKGICNIVCEEFVDFNRQEAKERARIGVLNDY